MLIDSDIEVAAIFDRRNGLGQSLLEWLDTYEAAMRSLFGLMKQMLAGAAADLESDVGDRLREYRSEVGGRFGVSIYHQLRQPPGDDLGPPWAERSSLSAAMKLVPPIGHADRPRLN